MKDETSVLTPGVFAPGVLRLAGCDSRERPAALLGLLVRPFESLRTGRWLWETVRRRECDTRVPGTQFSLSESPPSTSRSSFGVLEFLRVDGAFSPRGLRPVSSRPSEETVRESLRRFSRIAGIGVFWFSEAGVRRECLADTLRVRER